MIAITFALPAESSDFVRLLENKSVVSREGVETIRGDLHQQPVAVLHTGVGAAASRSPLETFLRRQRVDYLVSAGFAGALDRELHVGDLLIAENFSSPELLKSPHLDVTEPQMYLGKLVSVETMIDGETERTALASKSGAAAVDMETEAIADACAKRGVQMLSLRAISDTVDEPFPAPPHVLFDLEKQKTNAARLAFYLATHPARINRLRAFSEQIARTRESLTKALDSLMRHKLR